MLELLESLKKQGADFAFETTLTARLTFPAILILWSR